MSNVTVPRELFQELIQFLKDTEIVVLESDYMPTMLSYDLDSFIKRLEECNAKPLGLDETLLP